MSTFRRTEVVEGLACADQLRRVTVPATRRLCNLGCATEHHSLFLLFSFTNEVLVQRDLMWYW